MKLYEITYVSGKKEIYRAENILMVLAQQYFNVNIITSIVEIDPQP